MTLDDIIKLANAGYTKEDICKLTQAGEPAPAPAPAPDPAPAPAPNNPEPAPDGTDPLQAIQTQIETLRQMMQINNMLTVNQTGTPKERTIDDIFAEIINPPMPDKKDK